jgi:DNA-3-methyladenine glycosylase
VTKKQNKTTISKNILPREFYFQGTERVAKDLLGKKLVRKLPNGEILSGYIVETEAYVGAKDKACHAFGHKKTDRTSVMFEEGGLAYVYLIYGMYNCLNVVTRKEGCPEAVLIRALEPCEGLEFMQMKSREFNPHKILNGPGKLCKVLEIDRNLNRHDLTAPPLWIEQGIEIVPREVTKSARINISYAEEWAEKLLRFSIKDTPFISKKIKA